MHIELPLTWFGGPAAAAGTPASGTESGARCSESGPGLEGGEAEWHMGPGMTECSTQWGPEPPGSSRPWGYSQP